MIRPLRRAHLATMAILALLILLGLAAALRTRPRPRPSDRLPPSSPDRPGAR